MMLCCAVLFSAVLCTAVVDSSTAIWHDRDHPDHLGPGDDTPDRVWWHCGQEQQAGLCSTMQVSSANCISLRPPAGSSCRACRGPRAHPVWSLTVWRRYGCLVVRILGQQLCYHNHEGVVSTADV
jgi:hypothetical protein